MYDKSFCKSCTSKRKCVLSATQCGSYNVLELPKCGVSMFSRSRFYLLCTKNPIYEFNFLKESPKNSKISIPFLIINYDNSKNKTVPWWNLLNLFNLLFQTCLVVSKPSSSLSEPGHSFFALWQQRVNYTYLWCK